MKPNKDESLEAVPNIEQVASAVPAWLSRATTAQRQAYAAAALNSAQSQHDLRQLLGGLQAPQSFVRQRLAQPLRAAGQPALELDQYELISLHRPSTNMDWQVEAQLKVDRHNLLAAAMANFTAAEAEPNGFETGSVILPSGEFKTRPGGDRLYDYDPTKTVAMHPYQFAQTCRQVDLGKAYAAHFQSVLAPVDGAADVKKRLTDNLRNDLHLQVLRAQMTGKLGAIAAQVVLRLVNIDTGADAEPDFDDPVVKWGSEIAVVQSVHMLVSWSQSGIALQRALVIRQGQASDAPCIAYLPGDPQQPLREYPSPQAFNDDLRERLRTVEYQRFFNAFVALNQQSVFRARLRGVLNPPSIWHPSLPGPADTTADLGLRFTAQDEPLLRVLRRSLVEQLRGDAQTQVVANAEVDKHVRQARLQELLAVGMDALQVASLFIPVVGTLLLGAGALQLLNEVFVGVDDWTHGQTHEAIEHLLSVAGNVALVGATAGLGATVERSAFVEGMLPVRGGDGRVRLARWQVQDFASDVELPATLSANGHGQFEYRGGHYIKYAGKLYRQRFDDARQQWSIPHPDPAVEQSLDLRHNGSGAWRLAHEDPRQWTAVEALRRLGPDVATLAEPKLQQLALACGYREAELIRLHLDGLPRPALLQESIDDCLLGLDAGLRGRDDAAWAGMPSVALPLRRMFPGLPARAAGELAAGASAPEQVQLFEHQRVPLRLAEQARIMLRERQLNRALLGLLGPATDVGDAWKLKQVLGLPGDTPQALFLRACTDRSGAARALGQQRTPAWWRPPSRLPDGRIGYALSGRGASPAARYERRMRRLRVLYPQLDDVELQIVHAELGASADLNLLRRTREYEQLRHSVSHWAEEPATVVNSAAERVAVDPALRRTVRDEILAAWRRESPTTVSEYGRGRGYVLDICDRPIGNLPPINADFGHVFMLAAGDCQLELIPEGWLRNFPHLEELELYGNRLTAIPSDVRTLRHLDGLSLDRNLLQPSDDLFEPLSELDYLQCLSLSDNPMPWSATMMSRLGELRSLRTLALDNTVVGQVPELVGHLRGLVDLDSLWLRRNALELTPALVEQLAGLRNLLHLSLSHNPLGTHFDLAALDQLEVLGLRDCGLSQWPRGLTALMSLHPPVLRSIGLDDNPLATVPVLQGLPFFTVVEDTFQPLRISALHMDAVGRGHLAAARVLPIDLALPDAAHLAPGWVGPDDWRVDCPDDVLQMADALRAEPDAQAFMELLQRTGEVQDYRIDPVRGRRRVQDLIRALAQPGAGDDGQGLEHLRRQVFMIGSEVRDTCGDGIQLLLQRCETLVMAHQAAVSAQGAAAPVAVLRNLARQLFRADLLDDAAMRIAQRREALHAFRRQQDAAAVDPAVDAPPPALPPPLYPQDVYDVSEEPYGPDLAEIRLRLRLDLASRLDLPPQPTSMRYFQTMPDSLREQVALDVQNQDTEEGFLDWLQAQPFWTDRLERRFPARFAQVDRDWNAGHEYLFELGSADPQPADVPPSVLAVLSEMLGDRGWRVDGRMQVVRLTDAEQDTARQALLAGARQARAALYRELSVNGLNREEG